MVYLTYSPGYDSSSIPMYNLFLDDGQQWLKNNRYDFISWEHVRKYSQQICNSLFVDIICIGLYMLVSVTYSVIIYMCNCGAKHGMRLSKLVRYLYKIVLITQTTLSCMVKFKQTTVICNIKYVLVTIEFELSYVIIHLKIHYCNLAIYRGGRFAQNGGRFAHIWGN